jgi:hypothetical protein
MADMSAVSVEPTAAVPEIVGEPVIAGAVGNVTAALSTEVRDVAYEFEAVNLTL